MAITLDIIADKQFSDVGGGYSKNEVDDFLNEILDEMENRENETKSLRNQVASLTQQLADANEKARAAASQAAQAAPAAPAVSNTGKRSTESFELVLSKAQSVYEEIVNEADKKASDIVAKANDDAVQIRANAEARISDLSGKYAALRQQTADFYNGVKKLLDEEGASLESLKNILG